MTISRQTQEQGIFVPGDPPAGYYNDLRGVASAYDTPAHAMGWLDVLFRRREYLNPVSIVQLGIGAWQLLDQQPQWRPVLERVALFLMFDMNDDGALDYRFGMPHTYELEAPWQSAMAQGQATSLLVRAAHTLGRDELYDTAALTAQLLQQHDSGIVATTDEGPVLQEYPTSPPAHVLNGWIFALWGLYDLAHAPGAAAAARERAADSFAVGVETLVRRLPLYEVRGGWSRYDLYPHPVIHVASPFYHRLHVAQLRALHGLCGHDQLLVTADRWHAAAVRRRTVATAVARKVGFRLLRPRGGRAA